MKQDGIGFHTRGINLQALARGVGRTKKESESQAAEKALRSIEAADAELKKTEKARRKAEKAQAKKAEREARLTQKD